MFKREQSMPCYRFISYLLPLLLLTACATLTADSDQPIAVTTQPAGAACTLTNSQSSWSIAKTPGTVAVKRSFSPLVIACQKAAAKGVQTLQPGTRNRAYGNILLFGVPALVDAGTGDGYEYDPASVTLARH